jgi:predicted Ser/Thr protein kinase
MNVDVAALSAAIDAALPAAMADKGGEGVKGGKRAKGVEGVEGVEGVAGAKPDERHQVARLLVAALVRQRYVRAVIGNLNRHVLPFGVEPEAPGGCLPAKLVVSGPLGEGAFGRVFAATGNRAVKVVKLGEQRWRTVSDVRAAFLNEVAMHRVAAAAGVAPRLHDGYACCSRFGECYGLLVMDRVRGVALHDWLRKPKLSLAARQAVAAALEAAVRKLHARGVYHNDLHPGNVMVTGGGKGVVIVDFGLAGGKGGRGRRRRPAGGDKRHDDFDVVDDVLRGKGDLGGWRESSPELDRIIDAVTAALLGSGAVQLVL